MKQITPNYVETEKRIELKDAFKIHDRFLLDRTINLSGFSFKKCFPDRTVNSIYFDTIDFKFLEESLEGGSKRKKCRIRWYGNQKDESNATFEIKIKHGHLSWKKLFTNSHTINPTACSWSTFIRSNFKDQKLSHYMHNLFPKSIVSYDRSYFTSLDKRVRLTIDNNLKSFSQNSSLRPNFKSKTYHENIIVLEIKVAETNSLLLRDVLKDFPFSPSRFSKYCNSLNY